MSSHNYSPVKPPAQPAVDTPAEEFIPLEENGNRNKSESPEDGEDALSTSHRLGQDPPLPNEEPPPLPNEPVPSQTEDDGWEPVWDENAQAFYFYNRITQKTQWENPRVPQAIQSTGTIDSGPPGTEAQSLPKKPIAGGYDPTIHGDYDPDADYAKAYDLASGAANGEEGTDTDASQAYAATGAFNRFTGKWQRADINPERFNDENKSKRQMNAFFDVDAAANSHDGKSLKAERSGKKLSKAELKAFKEKRREKKEEKRRAWLRD